MRIRHISRQKIIRRRRLAVVGCLGLVMIGIASGTIMMRSIAGSGSTPATILTTTLTGQPAPVALPMRVTIPSINVDALIAPAGIKSDGTMDIQKNPDQVAWYEFGTRPGDEGSAVIAGHSGWTGLHGSVFNNLRLLKAGDKVLVLDQTGASHTFVVRSMKEYSPTANAPEVFQSYDGKAHLNLVTCDGVWVNATQSDSSRLVVFTDAE